MGLDHQALGASRLRKVTLKSHLKRCSLADFLQLAVGANPDQPKGQFPILVLSIAREVLHCKGVL